MSYPSRVWRGGALLGLACVMAACAHVKRGELDSEVLQLRTEMDEGDTANSARISSVEDRVRLIEARMAELNAELSRIEDDFGAEIDRLALAIRFNMPVYFGFNSADVRPQDREILDRFQAIVSEYYPGADVTVEGFTDPAGSAAANLELGQRRADSVRGYLLERGFGASQVRAVSYGEAPDRLLRPKAEGPGETGIENRRVVLVIDHGGAPPRVVTSR